MLNPAQPGLSSSVPRGGQPFAFGRPPGTVIQCAYTVPDIDKAIAVYLDRFGAGS
jgi:hypothetical protein